MKTKKLRRSLTDSVIGGVSGGLGEYFDTDPVIFRILFVVLTLTGGGGVFVYLLMWIFIPKAEIFFGEEKDFSQNYSSSTKNSSTEEGKAETNAENTFDPNTANKDDNSLFKPKKNGNLIGGAILIMVGLFFLADDFFPWFNWEYLWPAALIIVGLAIIKINYNKNQ